MKRSIINKLLAGAMFTLAFIISAPVIAQSSGFDGAVFVGTNHNNTKTTADSGEPANRIAMFGRAADGTLTFIDFFDTGGQGSGPGERFAGDGLGSSHSVQLSDDRRWLFATNAGSNTVSVFRVHPDRLELTDVAPTGDGSPSHRFTNSVTIYGNLVYVLNSADEGSITGFRFNRNTGTLTPIPDSTRGLAANQTFPPDALFNPTQVSFTPTGTQLVVSIKDGADGLDPNNPATGPGRILVFGFDTRDGVPSETFVQNDLSNLGPFGFSFDARGRLFVALFIGGPNFSSAAGSFNINSDGTLSPISFPVFAGGEVDLCWVENNGAYAFGANYTTGTISSFRIGADGSLTLLNATAGLTDVPDPFRSQGSTPLDLGISRGGNYLYNILPGSGKVAGWRINSDGSLTKIGEFAGLGQTLEGDMAPEPFSPLESPAGIAVY